MSTSSLWIACTTPKVLQGGSEVLGDFRATLTHPAPHRRTQATAWVTRTASLQLAIYPYALNGTSEQSAEQRNGNEHSPKTKVRVIAEVEATSVKVGDVRKVVCRFELPEGTYYRVNSTRTDSNFAVLVRPRFGSHLATNALGDGFTSCPPCVYARYRKCR
jgi:hypothetical protein